VWLQIVQLDLKMQQMFGNNSIEYDRSTVMTGVGR